MMITTGVGKDGYFWAEVVEPIIDVFAWARITAKRNEIAEWCNDVFTDRFYITGSNAIYHFELEEDRTFFLVKWS